MFLYVSLLIQMLSYGRRGKTKIVLPLLVMMIPYM